MAYDSARGVTLLFGGAAGGTYDGETWEWDGTSWTLRSSSGPEPRVYHAMAYDSTRGVTVLFGGRGAGGRYGDTWEWDGTSWTHRSSSGPSARNATAMTYDSVRGVTVLFGGQEPGYDYDDETWEGTGWYSLDLTLKNPGPSWVDIDPNDPNCPDVYPPGTEVTLTAVPSGDKSFKRWKLWDPNHPDDANYNVHDANNPITILMNANRKVEAVFDCGGGIAPPLFVLSGLVGLALLRRGRVGGV